jgi:hypothetical protein
MNAAHRFELLCMQSLNASDRIGVSGLARFQRCGKSSLQGEVGGDLSLLRAMGCHLDFINDSNG